MADTNSGNATVEELTRQRDAAEAETKALRAQLEKAHERNRNQKAALRAEVTTRETAQRAWASLTSDYKWMQEQRDLYKEASKRGSAECEKLRDHLADATFQAYRLEGETRGELDERIWQMILRRRERGE